MADTNVFSRLKRLFSTNVIIRNVGGTQLKVMDVDRSQAFGDVATNSLMDRYTRLHKTNVGSINPSQYNPTLRFQMYNDYELMDQDSIIASALDVIADECTLKSAQGEVLSIRSSDENIQRVLYNLFYDILNIEFNLWSWIRNMCKYGDNYLFLEIADKHGVYNVIPLTTYDISRLEGLNPQNPSEVVFQYEPNGMNPQMAYMAQNKKHFQNYEIAHFRLLADSNYLPYGRSFIEPARKTYKQYSMMKDAMLLHRIIRSGEKRVYYVDVGSIPPNEVDAYMEKMQNKMKKTPYVDPQTGEYNLRFNLQNSMEDFFIPQRGANSNTKIDTLKGLEYAAIDDVNFLRDEMLAALKVPKAYFGFEKDLQGKATLAAEDIRFARTVERIQRITVSELTKIALVHLYTQGFDGESLTNFELSLTTPSIVYKQEQIALWKEQIGLAKDMQDTGLFPSNFIYDKVFEVSEEQFDEMRDLVIEDKKRLFRLNQIENEGNDPAKTGKSYGTPHDLASMYGKGRYGNGEVPQGYDEKDPVGRPTEKDSIFGTQDSHLGKDPIGSDEYHNTPSVDKNPLQHQFKGGSPISLSEFNKIKNSLPTKKIILFEDKSKDDGEGGLLDERNIQGI
jgi:hypothetical protein